ncbi:aldo/keto reductase [Coprinopsis marcescibilis]|uniref:Aldo/keto reductase n=1 Tax=Coprinopsis marcescibilis TaxID=230819 RepID=A0A5C3L9I1_COPMA|nr:aldo/keto reductase [Coprinopsis marcescibilis]
MTKVTQSTKLGGTASDVQIGTVAHGLMLMVWMPGANTDEQCFESIKAGVDALPPGTKMFLNAGEFYAHDLGTANLELLSRFYAKYPNYADKTFLSVKGGIDNKMQPHGSLEFLRNSVDNVLRALGPNKKLDLYQPARIDRSIPLEELIGNLVTLQKEGKFDHIGLSELTGATLRKAHARCTRVDVIPRPFHKIHPITAAEVEISPWSYEQRTKDLLEASKELGVSVLAYSPLGHGFLTGQIKSVSELQEGDFRLRLSRTKEEYFEHNMAMVEKLSTIAKRLGVTNAQLCISWVKHLGPNVVPLPGSSKATRTLENLAAGDIQLSTEDFAEITNIVENGEIKGDRYFGLPEEAMGLWT